MKSHYLEGEQPFGPYPVHSKVSLAKELLAEMTEEERFEVFSDFCRHCGVYLIRGDGSRSRCHCTNDE